MVLGDGLSFWKRICVFNKNVQACALILKPGSVVADVFCADVNSDFWVRFWSHSRSVQGDRATLSSLPPSLFPWFRFTCGGKTKSCDRRWAWCVHCPTACIYFHVTPDALMYLVSLHRSNYHPCARVCVCVNHIICLPAADQLPDELPSPPTQPYGG